MRAIRDRGQEQAPAERVGAIGPEQAGARRLVADLAAATAFAALTALGARVQVHLPFTPVPVTGQVFCVLLAGAALGPRVGFVSMVEYLAAGAAGLPVFAYGGGPAALLGPTGGYLVGFAFAAAAVGALAFRGMGWKVFAGCACGVAIIHLLGAGWYAVWSLATTGAAALPAVLAQAVVPFVGVDVVKAAAAAAVTPSIRGRIRVG
ncbi:MAG: biotin transporter BioY [Armatimonadota bacterium]